MTRFHAKALSFILSIMLVLGTLPAAALGEVAEGAMGEEPASAQPTGRDGARGERDAAGLASMAEEGAPAGEEVAAVELVAQEVAAQDEHGETEVVAEGSEPGLSAQSLGRLYNPRVAVRSGMESGQVVTWDCVWFGSYPQTEVPETAALRNASWASRSEADTSDATVGGVRYRRISRDEATSSDNWWSDAGAYRYFRYFRFEPIKWRVLKVSGNIALVVADVALDCRPYHKSYADVTWETSTIRSWLNGTGGPYFKDDPSPWVLHYGFSDVAFPGDQLTLGTRPATVTNANNMKYGTPGGNTTSDRVFLLSESEVHGASATAHGFVSDLDTYDEARRCKATDYARAMGAWVYSSGTYAGNCDWWLRSPGERANCAADVYGVGSVARDGHYVYDGNNAVRPALNLNLSSSYLTWAGTVSSDGTVDGQAIPGSGWSAPKPDISGATIAAIPDQAWTGREVRPRPAVTYGGKTLTGADCSYSYKNNVDAGTATVTVTGMGNYRGTKSATFKIVRAYGKVFPDVPASAWYCESVERAVEYGLFSGYSDGRFGPDDPVTRGQVAVILWNMAGKPAARSGARSFPDVKSGAYYHKAVRWASSVGVVSGYGSGRFGPNDNVTREQLAVMLANYARKVAGRKVSGSVVDYARMKDRSKVSPWAQASVGWCFRNKILSGTKDGNVNPQGNATRAQAAKMVVLLHDMP